MAYREQHPSRIGTTRRNPFTGDQLRGERNQFGEPMGSRDPMFPQGGGSNLDAGVFAPRQFPGAPIVRSPLAPAMRPTGVGPASGLRTGGLITGNLRTPRQPTAMTLPGGPAAAPSGMATRGSDAISQASMPMPPVGVTSPASAFQGGLPNDALGTPSARGVMIDPKYQTPGASPIGVISGGTVSQTPGDPTSAKYDPASGQTFPGAPATPPNGQLHDRMTAAVSGSMSTAPQSSPSSPRPGFGDLHMAESQSAPAPRPQFPGMAALRMADAQPNQIQRPQPGLLDKVGAGIADAFGTQGKLMNAPAPTPASASAPPPSPAASSAAPNAVPKVNGEMLLERNRRTGRMTFPS